MTTRADALAWMEEATDGVAAWTAAAGACEIVLALTGMLADRAAAHPEAAEVLRDAAASVMAAARTGDADETMARAAQMQQAWAAFTAIADAAGAIAAHAPLDAEFRRRLP